MRLLQQLAHGYYWSYVKLCSDHDVRTIPGACFLSVLYQKQSSNHCNEVMKTADLCFLLELYQTSLRPLSWWDDNHWRMLLIQTTQNHAPTIVTMWGQQLTHVSYPGYLKPCPDLCYVLMTTAGVCFLLKTYRTMLLPLSWCEDTTGACFRSELPKPMLLPLSWVDDNSWRMFPIEDI